MEIIELLSDAGTPPPGDATNPIVLDSDDESDQRGSSVHPLPEASHFTPRPKNIHPDPPSGSNHLARSHTLQSSSPATSNTGDEFHDAESSSVRRASLPPPSEHSIQAVDQPSLVNGKTHQTPLPIRDSSEIQDEMPNGVSENTHEASSPVASSPPPTSPESRNMGISDRLAISPISSSPNGKHLPPVDAPAVSSFVPVRGTLYSGQSGLWKGFFRVTGSASKHHFGTRATPSPSPLPEPKQDFGVRTTKSPSPKLKHHFGFRRILSPSPSPKHHFGIRATPEPEPEPEHDISPSKPSRDIDVEEKGDARTKEAPTPLHVNSPWKFTPTTLVSLAQHMSIRSSPTPSSVDGISLEILDDPTMESVSSTVIGEPTR